LSRRVKRLLLACLAFGLATTAHAEPGVAVDIAPDWRHPGQAFEGWGTALAWFAHVTGGFADPLRNRLADMLYGEDGLRLNIARYNIGGGNAPETPAYLRPGADVPGFWRRPAGAAGNDWWHAGDENDWDWTADAGQRWWLDAIKVRVPAKDRIYEAFSNSPPYFMTISGRVSGNEDGLAGNLRPGLEGPFAEYLVRVTQELQKHHGIVFRTLSPVNEPNTPYWFAANTQEGAHWSPDAQSRVFLAVDAALKSHGLATRVSGPDETNAQTFERDWAGLSDAARATIAQINVHSYETIGKTGVRDVAAVTGKRLWMSEVDLSPANVREDYADMRPAIALGEQIVSDINRLHPRAWVLWQAVENQSRDPKTSSDWGLIKTGYGAGDAPPIHVTMKYWAFGNFTRFIRPGDRFVPAADPDTVVAVGAGGRRLVVVHVNSGLVPRRLDLHLPPAFKGPLSVQTVVTDANHRLAPSPPVRFGRRAAVDAAPLSVTTVIVTQANGDGRRGRNALDTRAIRQGADSGHD